VSRLGAVSTADLGSLIREDVVMRVTKRKPDAVGIILREEFIEPYGITQDKLAGAMGVTRTFVNELVNDRRGVTIDTAIMLGKVFNISPEFWLNMQMDNSLWKARNDARKKIKFRKIINISQILAAAA
jgi:antitoxin HigA-1